MKKENGITLIALVITIIVLLILAGVSIAILTGENGILTQAQNAKNKTEEAAKQEEAALKELEEKIDGVAQVTDSEPGKLEGEGTAENPYTISSIEDLVVFSHEVTNGRTFKKEDGTKEYVQLAQSLDFQSDKSYVNPEREDYGTYGYNGKLKEVLNQTGFIPIGIIAGNPGEPYTKFSENSFCGNFDGKRNKIYNLKIIQNIDLNQEVYVSIGMFTANFGTIENLGLEQGNISASIKSQKFSSTAMLVGMNFGKIMECYITGKVITEIEPYENTSSNIPGGNVGGLVGSNRGKIAKSNSEVDVMSTNMGNYSFRIGGVAGVNEDGATIENSYNTGNIFATISKTGALIIGGITGCDFGNIRNSYNIGTIGNEQENIKEIRIGSITGRQNLVTNSYYLENTVSLLDKNINITVSGEEKTGKEMKQEDFLELLNKDNETSIWKINSNKNQGYPILYWQ